MNTTVMVVIACSLGGIAAGAFFHSLIVKDAGVAKTDVAKWIADVRTALASEAESAKVKFEQVVAGIQKKL
jgi:hypothetical protein